MDSKLKSLMAVFFVVFALFVGFVMYRSNIAGILRAQQEFKPSGDTTLILAFPLIIKADGQTPADISVFVRDQNTRPVSNRTVTLTSSLGTIDTPSVSSDANGKASAHLVCNTSGIAEIHAIIDGSINVKQTVSVKCN